MSESTFDKRDKQQGDISALRLDIDEIDTNILNLINQRLLLALKIGAAKKQDSIQIIDRGREKEIIERLQRTNSGPLEAGGLQRIFEAIIAAGRSVQKTDRRSK